MKKYLMGIIAIVTAFCLSAFSYESKSSNDLYYWYQQSDHTYVGSSSSPSGNPLGCSAAGENCVKGYLRSSQPPSEPSGDPDEKFSFNSK
jgi:hypothetical protein